MSDKTFVRALERRDVMRHQTEQFRQKLQQYKKPLDTRGFGPIQLEERIVKPAKTPTTV